MKTNLSSQITLNRVSPRYYRPENAFERSVLTRLEKIPTDIYESAEEGANQIALDIAQLIRDKQKAGRFCVLALAGGNSPRRLGTYAPGRGIKFPQRSHIQPLRILSISSQCHQQQLQRIEGNADRPCGH